MKKFISPIVITVLTILLIISTVANTGYVQKTLLYDNIRITLDGSELVPTDANGIYVEPFIIDGTTYLPVRGIANSLGLGVDWDGNTNTVILTSPEKADAPSIPEAPAVTPEAPAVTPEVSEAPSVPAFGSVNTQTVLYNENGIKITYIGLEMEKSSYRDEINVKLLIENNSSQQLELYCDEGRTAINGFIADGLLVSDVAPGKKIYDYYSFDVEDLKDFGVSKIEDIKTLELGFHYRFNGNYVYIDPCLAFSIPGNTVSVLPTNGTVIYNENGVKITYLEMVKDKPYTDKISAKLLIENNSSQFIELYSDEGRTAINGFMSDGLMISDIAPGKKIYDYFYFDIEDLKGIGVSKIEDIKSLELGFHYRFNDRYVYIGPCSAFK